MRLRVLISFCAALLIGVQGPVCMLICQSAFAQESAIVAHSEAPEPSMPCHGAPADPPASDAPGPAECPSDCTSCNDEAPALVTSAGDASPTPLQLAALPWSVSAVHTPAPWTRTRIVVANERPPPTHLFLLKSSLLI